MLPSGGPGATEALAGGWQSYGLLGVYRVCQDFPGPQHSILTETFMKEKHTQKGDSSPGDPLGRG